MIVLYLAYALLVLGAIVLVAARAVAHRKTAREIMRLSEEWHSATDRLTQSVESFLSSLSATAESRPQQTVAKCVYDENVVWLSVHDAESLFIIRGIEELSKEYWRFRWSYAEWLTPELRVARRKPYSSVVPHRKYDYKVPALRTT